MSVSLAARGASKSSPVLESGSASGDCDSGAAVVVPLGLAEGSADADGSGDPARETVIVTVRTAPTGDATHDAFVSAHRVLDDPGRSARNA